MKGSEAWLIQFMEGTTKRFVIPVYQRNYDWRIEHCEQLYNDLLRVSLNNRTSHFFGSIVSVYNNNAKQEEHLIIDGQQRLTTISLLLLAIHNLIQAGKVESNNPNLGQKIYEVYLVDKWESQEPRIKLKPIKNDQRAFSCLFNTDEENIAESNLTINYYYFYDRIQKAEITVDSLFDAISLLQIINIKLSNDDNPQLIFESLNSTGLELSEGDKIRNYILMGLPSDLQELYYDKYWCKIEAHTNYDVSSFIRDYLSIKLQVTPKRDNVYFAFKNFVEQSDLHGTEELLTDMLKYAKWYEYLLEANSPVASVNGCIYRLNRIKTTVTRPFLLEAFRMFMSGKISSNDLYGIFNVLENYIFRRTICSISSQGLNKVFTLLHREIIGYDGTELDYFEKFKYSIIKKKGTFHYPTDEEFLTSLSIRDVYRMTSESKQYLFERLENANTRETKNIWEHYENEVYSIEHIMPRHLTTVWRQELGDSYATIHSLWLNRIANLTLTGYNSTYSNRSFLEKRDMKNGYKQSGLRLNYWIAQQENWGEPELEMRNNFLLAQALEIWPNISSSYLPPAIPTDMITLDEDLVFTGKKITKYSLLGIDQVATSWIEMFHLVILQLHARDKSIFMQLAVCNESSNDIAQNFSLEKNVWDSYREIETNLYVNANTSTQRKVNILRRIFPMFGLDLSDLVFYFNLDEDPTEAHLVQ